LCPDYGSLPITDHEYPLMHYTKLISEEHFTAGRPLVIVLPLVKEGTRNEEVVYLIEALHTSARWPILVYNMGYNMKRNMYTEINQDGSYIILTSGNCEELYLYGSPFKEQLLHLIFDNNRNHSWNPRAKYVVPVMSNCTQFDNKIISRKNLKLLWNFRVMETVVFFLKPNEHIGNDLQKNTADSIQGTYSELHTFYPYENSEGCISTKDPLTVKVSTMRNFSDFKRSDIFSGYIDKSLHGCPIYFYIDKYDFSVYSTKYSKYNAID
jgi:hypothetical protein